MKKIICTLLIIMFAVSLFGCDPGETQIKEYKGTPLTQLIYESINYNGGYTMTYVFDFNQNTVTQRGCIPGNDNIDDFGTIAVFDEQQEKVLINKLYSYGFFDLKEEYKTTEIIMDGGGWNLEIKYSDGTNKLSKGDNSAPDEVFSNCAKAFYDVCRKGIVASVPENYYFPPNISYSIQYTVDDTTTSNGFSAIRGNYKWNGFEENSIDIYELNQDFDLRYELLGDISYKLVLYTANYRDYDRFKKCEVTSYDYNEEMTSKKTILERGWFDQIELDLELNKIYVIKLSFANGDFGEYTFNTKLQTTQKE